jgi:hypothetical protein
MDGIGFCGHSEEKPLQETGPDKAVSPEYVDKYQVIKITAYLGDSVLLHQSHRKENADYAGYERNE